MNMKKNISIWKISKSIIKKFSRMPFKSSIMCVFIPIITVIVAIVGVSSFLLAQKQIEENAYTSVNDTVSQTKNYLDNRLYDIFEQFVALENDSNILKVESKLSEGETVDLSSDIYLNTDTNLNRIYSSYGSIISSIIVYMNNGRFFLCKSNYVLSKIDFSFDDYAKTYGKSGYHWVNLKEKSVLLDKKEEYDGGSLFKLIGDENSNLKGILLFNLRADFFKNILDNPQISENGYLGLVTDEGVMCFKNVKDKYQMNEDVINRLRLAKMKQGNFKFKAASGENMIAVYNTIKLNNWRLVAVLPEKEIISKANYIKYITIVLVIFLIIFGITLSNILAKILSKPVVDLTRKVKKVREGDLDVPFDIDASNEVGVLNNVIGELLKKIKNLLVTVKEEQEKKTHLEMEVLQEQINPHFLYNTLYSIKQLCDLGESDNAGKMISALSNFFRIGISRGNEIIKVEEEIEHVKNYLYIQNMRYCDDFTYEINIQPTILKCKIVKLTLQPLVENAIYHGVKKKRGKGLICIYGTMVEDDIKIEVIDNGAGVTEDRLKEIQQCLYSVEDKKKALGFGLRNVHQRLQLHYGNKYGIEIKSNVDNGTVISVKIPVIYD